MYYSKTTGGFYNREIHGDNIPADAVEITAQEHAALLRGQSEGRSIVADATGHPVLAALPVPTLAEVKAAVWGQIKAERDRRTAASGFAVGAKWYHSDLHSKTQHLGNKDTARDQLAGGAAMASALLDPTSGQQINWKTMDGSFQPLTLQLAFDIVKAGKGAEFAHFKAAETHKAAMEASADPAGYDFKSAGWPAAFGG